MNDSDHSTLTGTADSGGSSTPGTDADGTGTGNGQQNPDDPGTDRTSGDGTGTGTGGTDTGDPGEPGPDPDGDGVCAFRGCFTVNDPDDPATTPVVTINDIAGFVPASGIDSMEPNGWIVVGLDTNFYSNAVRNIATGKLLGSDAFVRFTPYAWHWNYGDGHALDSSQPGATWKKLDQDEFTKTATSHVYAEAGDYTITLTIDFTAEYSFGGERWNPIDGHVTRAVPPIDATAGDAGTVLVNHDCDANASGPGC